MKSVLPAYLNVTETAKEGQIFCGFWCHKFRLSLETGTTTNDHPADFSLYVDLQSTSEKYLYPTGKPPVTF